MRRLYYFVVVCSVFISCKSKPVRFELLDADHTGIRFVNEVIEKDSFNILRNEYIYNGGGIGAGDLNNDGLQDLVFSGNKVQSKIYLNLGDLKFKDITSAFHGLNNDQWYSGVAIADVNADGWMDVYLTSTNSKDSLNRRNRLWINEGVNTNGDLSFKEASEQFNVAEDGYSVHAGFFDFDLDGDLDLYVLNNIVSKSVPTNYRPKVDDGTAINNDKLYENLGNGKFKDITLEAGIVHEGYGLGLAFGDINKDSYPDIYVSNDYIANDILYINQGNGTFRNEAEKYFSYQSKFSMGNDMVDVNNDGNLDVMTMDMMPEDYFRKKQTINGHSYFIYINDEKYGYQHQYVRNMLHVHNGFINGEMLPFSEVGQMAGIYQTEWSWSPLFADYDNDGDRDLLVTNGYPRDLTDKDFANYKAQVYGYVATDQHVIDRIPIVKVPNYAFENTGNCSFRNVTENWGMKVPSYSNGAAFVDLDNDGDLDYVLNNINDHAFIYRNNTIGKLDTPTNYLRIRLKGSSNNTMAIGAKVEVWSRGNYQYHEHFLTRGYVSSVDPVIHFGFADSARVDSLRIIWPTGRTSTTLKDVSKNQLLSVDESSASPFVMTLDADSLMFVLQHDAVSYKHTEPDYVDFFQTQRIMQHKLSQIGPCLGRGDVNNDGTEDLIIGGSSEQPTAVYLFKNDRFVKTDLKGFTDKKKCLESDFAVFDADGDGSNDVIASSGGYANENTQDYKHYLYAGSSQGFIKKELPLPAFPASVVRPCDFDHDKDQDLFIGARVTRGSFPFAPRSYVIKNNGRGFSSADTIGFDLGMVTDAVWSDFNNDGWQDLIISREWDAIAILQNIEGKQFTLLSDEMLSAKHGFWSSLANADLDGDGDEDYILGNLGQNHRFTISEETPMKLYGVDIDKNGFVDPLTTAFWKDRKGVMREYPVNYFDELAAQSPFFRKRFTSYTSFSYATIDSILDESIKSSGKTFFVNTTSSFILRNNKGRFNWEELPASVQVAPVKEIIVDDFNDDGIPDILFAGNDHSFDVSTGYYDASKGTILLGTGGKNYRVLPNQKSGLVLNGQVNSVQLFNGKASYLVSGINRDSIRVYTFIKKPYVQ